MKRVFMLSSQPLFSQGIEKLLGQQPGLEIIGREADVHQALACIQALQPDVVILDSRDVASTPAAVVAEVLKVAPQARLISLNLENDQILVYHGERRIAQSADDLRDAIAAGAPLPAAIAAPEWLALAAGRAQVYAFLAAGLTQPLTTTTLSQIAGRARLALASLEQDVDLTGDLCDGLHALERFQLAARQQPPASLARALRAEFDLFSGAQAWAANGQACESAYAGAGAAALRASLYATYAACGFQPPSGQQARPDHIGCELEFMHHLCWREHQAWTRDARAEAVRLQATECRFLKEHLIRWMPRCCDALLTQARLDFYRGLLFLTRGFLLNEAYRVAPVMECAEPDEHLPLGRAPV